MSIPPFIGRFLILCAAFCGVSVVAWAGPAPHPGAAGNGGHLWVVTPAPSVGKPWQVLHHGPGMVVDGHPLSVQVDGGVGQPVRLESGAPAIVASAGALYVAVQTADDTEVRVEEIDAMAPSPGSPVWSYSRRMVKQLPASAKLRAMAFDGKQLWLAVETSPRGLFGKKEGETPAAAYPPPEVALALGLPPKGSLSRKLPDAALPDQSALMVFCVDEEGKAIANSFPVSPQAWLASTGRGRLMLALDAHTLWRREQGKWAPWAGDAGDFTMLASAADEMLVAQVSTKSELKGQAWGPNTLRVDWGVLRGNQRSPAGHCALPIGPDDGWSLVEWQGRAALAVIPVSPKSGQLAALLAPVDLKGAQLPVVEIRQEAGLQETVKAVFMLQGALFLVALALMIWNFRRGASRVLPRLPKHWAPASLWRRLCAMLIDLSLAVVPVSLAAGVAVEDILRHWPAFGEARGVGDMRLGLGCAGLFILHTAVGETFWGRSAGKLLTGLWVLDLNGHYAPAWRIVIRGLLKIMELIAPSMFALVLFSPFRQRLGDLTAGTVVVERSKSESTGL